MSDPDKPTEPTLWQECKAIAESAMPSMEEREAEIRAKLLEQLARESPELAVLLANSTGPVTVPENLVPADLREKLRQQR
jgi:hypothetical protein